MKLLLILLAIGFALACSDSFIWKIVGIALFIGLCYLFWLANMDWLGM